MSNPYQVLDLGGSPYVGSRHLYIYLYPNTSAEDDESENEIKNAIVSACTALENFGSIDYWELLINYDHPNISDSDDLAYENDFEDFIRNNSNNDYDQYKGVHVGVADGFDFANAEFVESDCQTAFDRDTIAIVGTGGVTGRYTNFAIQEPLHCAIRWDKIQGILIDTEGGFDPHEHEHDLGELTSDGWVTYVTPLATLYEDTHAQHGECPGANYWQGYYTNQITSCTKEAVKITANHEDGLSC